jgi:hypothetical protein
MVFKLLSTKEVAAKYKQTRTSSVSETPEWKSLIEALNTGLKRGDAAVIEVTPKSHGEADLKKAKALQGNFKRAIKKYLAKYAMPYAVRAMRDGNTRNLIVIVENRESGSRKR